MHRRTRKGGFSSGDRNLRKSVLKNETNKAAKEAAAREAAAREATIRKRMRLAMAKSNEELEMTKKLLGNL
jgi:hypothetical protein